MNDLNFKSFYFVKIENICFASKIDDLNINPMIL